MNATQRAIEQSRKHKSASEHHAWCELWIRAFGEDLRVERTLADRERLARSLQLLWKEVGK